MRISVRVTPRSASDRIGDFDADGTLSVRVTAAPTDGQANEAVTKLLAKALRLAPRDVTLVAGATSRKKQFEVPLDAEELRARLNQPPH